MVNRVDLHYALRDILGTDNVYFSPPENMKMQYPAFVYSRIGADVADADNNKYKVNFKYKVVYISRKPDSEDVIAKVLALPHSKYLTPFVADNLYHDVFEISV